MLPKLFKKSKNKQRGMIRMDKDQEKALRNLVAQLKSELEIVKLNQDKYMTLFNQIFKDITKMEQKIKEVEK